MFGYHPVVAADAPDYFGRALVGTYSTVIGWNVKNEALREGLRGFAVRRSEFDRDGELIELKWLGGFKRFAETDNGRSGDVGSLTAPFQRFRWNDYTICAGRNYRYEVFPMRGDVADLRRDDANRLSFEFSPTPEDDGMLGVYVNRGVTAAKAYFDRFKDIHPRDVRPEGAAYAWLSRGLKESLMRFIAETEAGQALHVAIYEFFDHEIASALRDARDRGVDILIVHDARAGKHSTEKSLEVVHHFGLEAQTVQRTTVNISHNKLVIRLVDGDAIEAWSGSANFSENAFHYQTNTALLIRDIEMCRNYEAYFQGLVGNPSKKDSKIYNRALMDDANDVNDRWAETCFFSPISQLDIIDASVDLIRSAESAVFISAPFGLHKDMITALAENDDRTLEYGLVNATAKRKIETLRQRSTQFYPPNKLQTHGGERWDAKAFGAHKIHAKSIVIDPFGENPKVLIGSANFSNSSCRNNDENALLIEGDKRLAAILTTEYMRMHDHYKSRYYIRRSVERNRDRARLGKPPRAFPIHLKSDDSWSRTAFDPTSNSHKFRDRMVFAGG